MHKRIKFCLLVTGGIFFLGNFFVRANPDDSDAMDFFVMNVCVDANDQPTLQNPLNTNKSVPPWTKQRNIRPGELLPYYPNSWKIDKRVSRRYSLLSHAVGTDQNGTRYPIIVSWMDHAGTGQWSSENNVSVRTIQDGYASGMGSTGGSHLSLTMGPGYLNPQSKGIARFNKAWVFFPVKLIPSNDVAYGCFSEQIAAYARDEFSPDKLPPPATSPSAASRLKSYFSLQAHQAFGFGPDSSVKLDCLITNKYGGRDEAGLSPGNAQALERSYFTREFGECRWEAWKRDDNKGKDVLAASSALYARGACGLPMSPVKANITPHFIVYPVQVVKTPQGHAYAQPVMNWDDKTQRMVKHTWYLVSCSDWTKVEVAPPFDPLAVVESKQNDLLKDLLSLFEFHGEP